MIHMCWSRAIEVGAKLDAFQYEYMFCIDSNEDYFLKFFRSTVTFEVCNYVSYINGSVTTNKSLLLFAQ